MSRKGAPLIVFDESEDFTTWEDVSGTPTVQSSSIDPFGGSGPAYQIGDDDAGNTEKLGIPNTSIVPNSGGNLIFHVFMQQGSSGSVAWELFSVSTGLISKAVFTWSTHQFNASIGNPELAVVQLGDGWFFLRYIDSIVGDAGPFKIQIEPATGAASNTGDVLVYGASAVMLGVALDSAVANSNPREGSEQTMNPAGVEDAWIRNEHMLQGTMRWIPTLDEALPQIRSGWEGEREHRMFNVGVEAWLRWARDKQSFLWVPYQEESHRHAVNSLLVQPFFNMPGLEDDGTKQLFIQIRSDGDGPYKGY